MEGLRDVIRGQPRDLPYRVLARAGRGPVQPARVLKHGSLSLSRTGAGRARVGARVPSLPESPSTRQLPSQRGECVMKFDPWLERYRARRGSYASEPGADYGAFDFPGPCGVNVHVIASPGAEDLR